MITRDENKGIKMLMDQCSSMLERMSRYNLISAELLAINFLVLLREYSFFQGNNAFELDGFNTISIIHSFQLLEKTKNL